MHVIDRTSAEQKVHSSALSTQHSSVTDSPSVARYGRGPDGWRCGSCANLRAVGIERPQNRAPQTIYSCCLVGQPRRVTWPACSRFILAPIAVVLS